MEKEVVENHKKYVERIDLYRSFGYNAEKERNIILEKAYPFGGRMLEVGTGKGYFTLALALKEYRFISVDISEEEQLIARHNVHYYGCEHCVEFRIENAERLSFKDGSFDSIFSVNMIHHLAHPFTVIDEFMRVLSLKGKMIVSDFTDEGFKVVDMIHQREEKKHEVSGNGLKSIKEYLKDNHFIIQEYRSSYQDIVVASRSI